MLATNGWTQSSGDIQMQLNIEIEIMHLILFYFIIYMNSWALP